MKTIRGNKGFTLIELLAVIVVLAIVSVLATRSVLPYMANAGKDAFVIEANEAISSASDAISLINIGSITETANSDDYSKSTAENVDTYCFSLKKLSDLGLLKKDLTGYAGTVVVTSSGKSYTYKVEMYNTKFMVTKQGQVAASDVNDVTDEGKAALKVKCSA